MAAIKKKNPSLKILFSLGGWNEGSVKFSNIAASHEKRKALAKNIAETIKLVHIILLYPKFSINSF